MPRLAALAAILATAALTGCSHADSPDIQQADSTAAAYTRAWLDAPSQPETMCRLQTTEMHPNYTADGGTLKGCIAAYTADFAGQDTNRPHLTTAVTKAQPLPATSTEPAGTGVLVTTQRAGEAPLRYAMRLVAGRTSWLVAQVKPVDEDLYGHAPDPVAAVLEAA